MTAWLQAHRVGVMAFHSTLALTSLAMLLVAPAPLMYEWAPKVWFCSLVTNVVALALLSGIG